ncbi:hypothetical protein [Staphylococcus xylosus]|uniref:hypothetical protein n=1 Tax=Staphylococcus xylosus TaxID=1288 RepID=UPI000D1D32A3|nr:hypothetical protein [Staphylococcus xylosus]PTI64467.1 hypothetical protein BU095_05105 [Staphylococcus xylosus]
MDKLSIMKVLKEQVKGTMKFDLIQNEEVLQHVSLLLAKTNVQVTDSNSLIVEVAPKEYKVYVIGIKRFYIVSAGFNGKASQMEILNNINKVKIKSKVDLDDTVYCEEIELNDIKVTVSEDTLRFSEFIDTALKTF